MEPTNVISIAAMIAFVVGCSAAAAAVAEPERFLAQLETISQEIDKWYTEEESNLTKNFKQTFGINSDAHRQIVRYRWPRQMTRVLQLATGVSPSSRVDMIKVTRIIAGLKRDAPFAKQEFLENFRKFLVTKFGHDAGDVDEIIKETQDELCKPYRPDSEGYFNFYDAINNLVELMELEDVDIRAFAHYVMNFNKPIAPLYSAAMICQVIDVITAEKISKAVIEDVGLDIARDDQNKINDWPYAF